MIKGCILPWMHLFGTVDGKYKLCCHIFTSDEVGNYTQPISTIFNNDEYKKTRLQMLKGEILSPCEKACYSKERLGGTISSGLYAMMQGVQIMRVHNINEVNQSIKIFKTLNFK